MTTPDTQKGIARILMGEGSQYTGLSVTPAERRKRARVAKWDRHVVCAEEQAWNPTSIFPNPFEPCKRRELAWANTGKCAFAFPHLRILDAARRG